MADEFELPDDGSAADPNPPPVTDAVPPLDEVTFVDEQVEPAPRPPGPGLPESLAWTAGVLITLFGAGIVWTVLFMVYLAAQQRQLSPFSVEAMMSGLSITERIMLLLPGSLLAFLVLVPLGLLRLGRNRLSKLNLAPPSLTQILIVLAAVYPTTYLTAPIFEIADSLWLRLSEGVPALEMLNEQSVMKVLEHLQSGSMLLLLLFLAVTPALGEEFVFRGVIGRGLTARWGVWWGVLFTSFLFALVHLYPPHVAAVLPIGIMLHVVYLATRSFWAPVLFHFGNNALAAISLGLGLEGEDETAPWMALPALAFLVLCSFLLYHYRTRYVNEQGEEISPGYVTVARPPADVAARRVAPVGWVVAPLYALILAGTTWYLASDLVTSLNEQRAAEEAGTASLLAPHPSAGLNPDDA